MPLTAVPYSLRTALLAEGAIRPEQINDAYARQNRIPVEEDKPAAERGTYLHPRAFGLDQGRGAERVCDLTQRNRQP